MSLQIWIPFVDGTLKQQGLKELTLSSSNTSVQNNGKLGKCLSFNGSSSVITSSQNVGITGDASYTIAFWMYWAGDTWSNDFVGIVGWGSMSTNESAYAIIYNGRPDLDFWNNRYLATNQLQVKKWYHIAMVKTPGSISTTTKIYVDGQEVAATANSTVTPSIVDSQLLIGRLNNSTNRWFNGYLNDVRIYDHALSPMEVKELSKGLMLHYPLSRNGFGQENIFLNSSLMDLTLENLSTKIKYTSPYIPVITDDGIKFTWSSSSAREVDLYLGDGLELDTYYTLSFIYRSNMNISSSAYLRSDNTLVGYWNQKTIPYSENWARYTYTFKPVSYQDRDVSTGNSLTLFYSGYTENKWIELKKNSIKLEKGTSITPWCPNSSDDLVTNLGLDLITEYDCSGFGNNGEKIGDLTYTSNTPKYIVSTHITNGANTRISTPSLFFPTNAVTLNIWFRSTNTLPTGNYHMVIDSVANRQWYEMCISKSGYLRAGLFVNGTRYADNCTTTTALNGNWHMLTMTYDGNIIKRYFDGIMEKSTSVTASSGLSTPTAIMLGRDGPNANYACIDVDLSDFRIYATALSADDVKALYENSGYIDNKGNIYGTLYEVG